MLFLRASVIEGFGVWGASEAEGLQGCRIVLLGLGFRGLGFKGLRVL